MSNNKQLATLLFLTQRIVQKHAKEKSCALSHLSIMQLETLRFVKNKEGSTMRELSSHLGIKPPSATAVIDELSKQGLIERQTVENDRRVIKIAISRKGDRQLEDSFNEFIKGFNHSTRHLSDKEKETLIKLLLKITE